MANAPTTLAPAMIVPSMLAPRASHAAFRACGLRSPRASPLPGCGTAVAPQVASPLLARRRGLCAAPPVTPLPADKPKRSQQVMRALMVLSCLVIMTAGTAAPSAAAGAAAAGQTTGPLALVKRGLHFVMHLDKELVSIVANYGAATYGILFGIVFAETGLVVTPFLPGDRCRTRPCLRTDISMQQLHACTCLFGCGDGVAARRQSCHLRSGSPKDRTTRPRAHTRTHTHTPSLSPAQTRTIHVQTHACTQPPVCVWNLGGDGRATAARGCRCLCGCGHSGRLPQLLGGVQGQSPLPLKWTPSVYYNMYKYTYMYV